MNRPQQYSPGPRSRTVIDPQGSVVSVPEGWELLPPGDAGLTRRVKAAGDHWVVCEQRGRKRFSRGVWASAETIARVRSQLAEERSTPAYARRQESQARRRDRAQAEYTREFEAAVLAFLDFDARHGEIARRLASAVTEHTVPVGSGTVARTQRIPLPERAAAAVIAWLRHQTTGYDNMRIPRRKGLRRETRRMLAEQSRKLLDSYRRGDAIRNDCPLAKALATDVAGGNPP